MRETIKIKLYLTKDLIYVEFIFIFSFQTKNELQPDIKNKLSRLIDFL